jgi:hypothetical protein
MSLTADEQTAVGRVCGRVSFFCFVPVHWAVLFPLLFEIVTSMLCCSYDAGSGLLHVVLWPVEKTS